MILIVQHWNFDQQRKNEILTTTLQNLKNKFIDKIYIFLENKSPKIIPSHNKIHYIEDSSRLTYSDMFNFCMKNFKDTCIIANADIIFDDTLIKTHNIDFTNTIVGLTSYDFNTRELSTWSFDSFIFKPITLNTKNVSLIGNEFSELLLSSDLITQGINIINPSMEIKSFHMDLYKKLKSHTKKEVLYYILPHYIIDKPVVFNNAKELNAPVSEATNIATVAVKADPSYSIAVKSTSKKIALVIHLYYHDLWDEMKTYINNLSTYNFDLYITLDKTSSTIGQNMWMRKVILKSYPTANILDIDNKGMDIGAFLQVLKYIKHNNLSYDYVCKIHTKKSIKSSGSTHGKVFGIHWRKKLIEPLLGSVENVERCLAKLSDERTALVTMNTNVSTFMSTNTEHVNYIKNMLNIRSGQLFVAGTMFWMKYNVLDKYFYNEDIIDSTYNILENGYTLDQEKGTYTHAMERIFGYMITDAKYNFGTI